VHFSIFLHRQLNTASVSRVALFLLSAIIGGCAGGETVPEGQLKTVAGERLQTRLVYSDDFEYLDDWVHVSAAQTDQGTQWTVENGRLLGRYGSEGASTLWSTKSLEGDVLIELDGKLSSPEEAWVSDGMPEGGKNLNLHFMVTGPEGGDIVEAYPELAAAGTGPNTMTEMVTRTY
jgi:hypothetical protein